MTDARFRHTATLLPNGKVLVTGGFNGYVTISSAELYDPAAGTWTQLGNFPGNRCDHTATLLPEGKVLVAGGYYSYGGGYLDTVTTQICIILQLGLGRGLDLSTMDAPITRQLCSPAGRY